MLPKKLTFVDVETTGMRVNLDRIIEIGVLRVEDNKLVETYQSLINPGFYIPPEISEMTGITSAQLENAPSFYEIKKELLKIFEDTIFVAHNVRFDYSFLKQEFKRFDISFSPKHFCTVKLSRALFPKYRHHNLDSIIERFGFECNKRHRAFDDAKVLWDFYKTIQTQFSLDKITTVLEKALKKPSLPIKLKQQDLEGLPEGPGVYIFYGSSGAPLYVGKSINIRDRVLSHFSGDLNSSKEMKISQQIESIETIETAGELSALLKESELVKALQPLYNRKLRLKKDLMILKSEIDKDGYQRIVFDQSGNIDVSELDKVLGVFRSKKQAKDFLVYIAKEHSLCEKLLGLENTRLGCFNYRLGRCKGACEKKESTLKYNLRFLEAFINSKIASWPFDGPIIIKEGNQPFVIDKWCCNGTSFDLDTYKIIKGYISRLKNDRNITLVKDASYLSSLDSFMASDMSLS